MKERLDVLLVKRNLAESREKAKALLMSGIVYVNGQKEDKAGTTFDEMYSLFLFDRAFRNIIFKNLLVIENNIKSIISYQLSKKYGYKEHEYLKPKNFTTAPDKSRQVQDLIKKMKRQVRVNAPQHSATSHYVNNYGYIPLWILVKVHVVLFLIS